jgi:hypothetical protein
MRRAVEAVLQQQFSGSWEVLVCDDGSQDGTEELMRQWCQKEARLHYLRQQQRGPAAARNLGIRKARAPLVAMTDDDCLPAPGWLAALYQAAQRPGIAGVEGRVTPGRSLGPGETAPHNESGGVYLTCNILYRRDVLAAVGGFDSRFPVAAFEDCDLAARARRHGEIAWCPEALVVHPPRPVTWRTSVQRLRHWPWMLVTARRYGYLGWPRYATGHPRARAIWSAVVTLPAGRLRSALVAVLVQPGPALRATLAAAVEPFLALFGAVPRILRFDLESAALHDDYLQLIRPGAPVGIVIVHYRQPELLLRCLESLRSLDYREVHTIVVESAGDPAEAARLQAQAPGVDWIVCEENVGYTGGNNLGIQQALERGCEYILLLNADTESIAPDFLARLVRFLELNPRVAMAGPRVYLRRSGQVQNTVLRYPSFVRQVVDWFGFRLFPNRYERSADAVRAAEMLNGVCVLLRAEALREVGLFDPRFFMYVEDADLGFRLRRAGWRIAYVPVDSIIHHQKETGYELEGQVSLLLRRNAVYFLRKHNRRMEAWALAFANLGLALARACGTASGGQFRRRLRFARALWQEFRSALLAPVQSQGPGS